MSKQRVPSKATWRRIKKALLDSNYQILPTARQQGVSEYWVFNAYRELRAERIGIVDRIISDASKVNETSEAIYFGRRKDPYFETEEQMLEGFPTYTATNLDRITPINPSWKLYQTIETDKNTEPF